MIGNHPDRLHRFFWLNLSSRLAPLPGEKRRIGRHGIWVKHPIAPASVTSEPYDVMKGNELVLAVGPITAPLLRPTHSPPRILVVDEDSDLRLLYTEALARPGYQVDAAGDGAAALKAFRVNNYNLLITEHDLPTLTGVELVRMLRAARMALPVIMAAARLPMHELARDPALQPVAVLPKPFHISQLLETVRAVLRATVGPCEQLDSLPNLRNQPSAGGLRL